MYAILETGGKQYRAEPGQELVVERLPTEPGATVEFERVALVEQDGAVNVGAPWLHGAKVTCRVVGHEQGRKVDVFFYKAKENLKRSRGHRQQYTRLLVEKVTAGSAAAEKEG